MEIILVFLYAKYVLDRRQLKRCLSDKYIHLGIYLPLEST